MAHRIEIERIDCGTSLARLEPGGAAEVSAEALLAFAHSSCGAAIDGLSAEVHCTLRYLPTTSRMNRLRAATGVLSAAALVERDSPWYLCDDIRRSGSAKTRVNVAVVDGSGDAVAFGTFEYVIDRV
jgi:hypothetical protein